MKRILTVLLVVSAIAAFAQPAKKGKEMKMAPIFAPGYYVSLKGDTVPGEVQTNLEKEHQFYLSFFFKGKGAAKAIELNSKKAKAYGYNDVYYTVYKIGEEDVYLKYLEHGRLNLFEYKMPKMEDGVEKYIPQYYIQDTKAAADDKEGTSKITILPDRNHKKTLKAFFADQPILLDPIDKWYFKIDEIKKAVKDFNAMYAQ
jgi:hypothetical protein